MGACLSSLKGAVHGGGAGGSLDLASKMELQPSVVQFPVQLVPARSASSGSKESPSTFV